jgi:hypothetical protein
MPVTPPRWGVRDTQARHTLPFKLYTPMYLPPPISKPVHDIEMEKAIKKGASQVMTSPFGRYDCITRSDSRTRKVRICIPLRSSKEPYGYLRGVISNMDIYPRYHPLS